MDSKARSHSPHILIYFELGEKRVRVADVLYDSATPYDKVDIPANSEGSLVFSIDGVETREAVRLDSGIKVDDELIKFTYLDANIINSRVFQV